MIDIESLTQEEYTERRLALEGLDYLAKAKFISNYQSSTMDTFIGTKKECDALFETTKEAGEKLYRERAKKINARAEEFRKIWFDHRTEDLTDTEKEFVIRLVDKLGEEVEEAIDRVHEFADLLK